MLALDNVADFQLFSTTHLFILGLTAGTSILLCTTAHFIKSAYVKYLGQGLGTLLLLNECLIRVIDYKTDVFSLTNSLPMHLCAWAVLATGIALISHKQLFYELAYFWGMTGTLQALITPDINGYPTSRIERLVCCEEIHNWHPLDNC